MIKCVAIDDEPIALRIIQEYCGRHGDIQLKCFTSPPEGMACVREWLPDIVFLDIEMNSHNGLRLAGEMPEGTCLIFTTAYAEYALDGFEADAVDFLHKPIFYPRFLKAIDKAKRLIGASADGQAAGRIALKSGHKTIVVNIADIVAVEAMDNYVKVFRFGLSSVVSQITMKEIEALLPSDRFLRIHRSYIIAVPFVEKFTGKEVHLRGFAAAVPAGRKYAPAIGRLKNMIVSIKSNNNL